MDEVTDAVKSLTAFVRFVTRPGWTFFFVPHHNLFEALDLAVEYDLDHDVWNFLLSREFELHCDCYVIGLPDGGNADLFWIAASHLYVGPVSDSALLGL